MMSRVVPTILLLILLSTTALAEGKFRKALPGNAIEGSYIVVYKDNVRGADAARSSADRFGGQVETTWSVINGAHFSGLREQAARALSRSNKVAWVEQDQVVLATHSGQPRDQIQAPAPWGLDRIDQRSLPLDSEYGYSLNTGAHAYVLDTGIRATHNQFGGRATQEIDFTGSGNTDCHGHGTHVAGVIGGATYGVAKDVTLHGVKVLDCQASGSISGVISGVNWVTNNHIPPAVANISLSGEFSSALNAAVESSIAEGVFYVVAAGNDNEHACTKSPAGNPQAYTVGSTTSSDAKSASSNIGPCLNIFAPGSSITSTWNTSDTATNTISGTSVASPHVAGVAALIASQGSFTVSEIKSYIDQNATLDAISGVPDDTVNALLFSVINTDVLPP